MGREINEKFLSGKQNFSLGVNTWNPSRPFNSVPVQDKVYPKCDTGHDTGIKPAQLLYKLHKLLTTASKISNRYLKLNDTNSQWVFFTSAIW